MASQVRPGLAQPDRALGFQQSVLLLRRQPAYSIRAHRDFASPTQAECMAAISSRETKTAKETLGNVGASMYGSRPTGGAWTTPTPTSPAGSTETNGPGESPGDPPQARRNLNLELLLFSAARTYVSSVDAPMKWRIPFFRASNRASICASHASKTSNFSGTLAISSFSKS